MKKIINRILIGIGLITVLGITLATTAFKDNTFEIVKNLDIYTSLFKELNTFYVDEIDPGKLIKTSIDKMLESLDPYTVYIPESDMEDFRFMTTGNYGGIGSLIRKQDDRVIITDPYENFPAQKAGLKAGDVILKIQDFDTKGKSVKQVSDKLKGQPGTKIEVTIKRPGKENPLVKEITRQKIHIPAVPCYAMKTKNIGYLTLSQFTHNASKDVKNALMDLKSQGATSYILDLRGNPGGLLDEAVSIVNMFVPKGELIVSTKGKMKKWNKQYVAQNDAIIPKAPLTILVNSGSASASEIVSGALQDLDRAVIIGTRTFGKGLVQTTRPLSYNAKLKLTTAKYYIPSGRCIQMLDYSHRKKDGSVGKVPDSLITKFNTKNGRDVYDGGGILPDVICKPRKLSNIAVSLIVHHQIFDFATQYQIETPSIAAPEKFQISDSTFQKFKNFLKDKKFDYKLTSVEKIDELEKSLKKEKYYSKVKTELEKVKTLLKHDKNKDLELFKEDIKELLSEEISSRYYYQKGRLLTSHQYDSQIDSAIAILNDSTRYSKILNPNK